VLRCNAKYDVDCVCIVILCRYVFAAFSP